MKTCYESILGAGLSDSVDLSVKQTAFLKFAKEWNDSDGPVGSGSDIANHKIMPGDAVICMEREGSINLGIVKSVDKKKVNVDMGYDRPFQYDFDALLVIPEKCLPELIRAWGKR